MTQKQETYTGVLYRRTWSKLRIGWGSINSLQSWGGWGWGGATIKSLETVALTSLL